MVADSSYKVGELAKILRVSPDKIRSWIRSGELGAVNVANVRCAKPQFIIRAHHWLNSRDAGTLGRQQKPQHDGKGYRD